MSVLPPQPLTFAPARASKRASLPRRWEHALIALGICLPVPVFAATGLSLPLPTTVERIAAALAPWAGDARLDENEALSTGIRGVIVRSPDEKPLAEAEAETISAKDHAAQATAAATGDRSKPDRHGGNANDSDGVRGGGGTDGGETTSSAGGGGGGTTTEPSPGENGGGSTPVQNVIDDVNDATEPVTDEVEDTVGDVADTAGDVVDTAEDAVDDILGGLGK